MAESVLERRTLKFRAQDGRGAWKHCGSSAGVPRGLSPEEGQTMERSPLPSLETQPRYGQGHLPILHPLKKKITTLHFYIQSWHSIKTLSGKTCNRDKSSNIEREKTDNRNRLLGDADMGSSDMNFNGEHI